MVKLIDVYPDEVAGDRGDGRLSAADRDGHLPRPLPRELSSTPQPITAGQAAEPTSSPCPTPNHVFLPGHRIMVQVQSSWFPLYDRNPQTFVANIFFAKPGDYQKATQRIYHAARRPASSSFRWLQIRRPGTQQQIERPGAMPGLSILFQ